MPRLIAAAILSSMSAGRVSMQLLVGLAIVACSAPTNSGDPPDEQPALGRVEPEPVLELPAEPMPKLSVSVAGCHALSTKPACFRWPRTPDKPLQLWLEGHYSQSVTVQLDGQVLSGERLEIEQHVDGLWLELRKPTSGKLEVGQPGYRPFVLDIESLSEAYADAFQALKNTGPGVARDEEQWPAFESFLLDCMRARQLPEVPREDFERLRARAEAVDELRCFAELATKLAYQSMYAREREYDQAATYLVDVRRHQKLDLLARINAEYHAAMLAWETGLVGEARHGLDRAIALAERAEEKKRLAGALIGQALVLAQIGRLDEALPLGERAVALVNGPDADSVALGVRFNKAWLDVLRRARDPALPDPSSELRRLIIEFADDPEMAAVARLNLAVAIMQGGDHALAKRELRQVDRERLDPRQQLYYELTRFRIAFAVGQPAVSRKWLDRADLLAEVSRDREFGLELLEARAELELHEGNEQAALAAFRTADGVADTLARQLPANAGRSSFWTTLSRSRARHVELALETGDLERALCTVLGARTRHLRALATGLQSEHVDPRRDAEYAKLLGDHRTQQRELEARIESAWRLSKRDLQAQLLQDERTREALDELLERAMQMREGDPPEWDCAAARPSTPGTALLTAYPSADGASWLFLLDHADEITWVRIDDDSNPEMLATRALEQFGNRGQLDAVTNLLVVPLGDLLAVNFQTLALLARSSGPRVRHGLGLGSMNVGSSAGEFAAVIGDASSNLSELETELVAVRRLLGARGWSLKDDWDPAAHEQPRLLHYGGHAAHTGLDGWGSYLDLPGGRLTSERLLLERRAPSLVVLGACDAGAVDTTMLDGGMNVAVALLLAGAQVVIAADREVEDSIALALATELYAVLPERGSVDVEALIAALTEVQRRDPRFDAWRAWVP